MNKSNNLGLATQRNKFAFRIKRGAAPFVLKHKNSLALFTFLELKPMFVCSIFYNDKGNLPYTKLANELRVSESKLRAQITQLEKLKLVYKDIHRNIHLATWQRFYDVIKFKYIHNSQHKFANNYNSASGLIKAIAVSEDFNKQQRGIFERILIQEWCSIHKENPTMSRERFYNRILKSELTKLKKRISKNWKYYFDKYNRIFFSQYDNTFECWQLKINFTPINPNVNLPCSKAAKIFNRASRSTGHYQLRKLINSGYIRSQSSYGKISKQSPAVFDTTRTDVFSFNYKTLLGYERKYFINMPNVYQSLIL